MAGLLAIVMYYGPGRGFAAGLGDPVGCTGLGGGGSFLLLRACGYCCLGLVSWGRAGHVSAQI